MMRETGSIVRHGLVLVFLGFFGSTNVPSTAAEGAAPVITANVGQAESVRISSFPEIWEPGSARERQQTLIQARSRYADGESQVTASQIRDFLSRHESPMTPHAEEIVFAGNRYGIDPRMIVAIAGVESQYGKRCRGFNAWGWNGGRTRWSSWTESIHMYSASMQSNYPNWRNIQGVAPRYNPNTPEAWGRKVAFLMHSIQPAA